MSSIRDEATAVLNRLDGALDELIGLDVTELTTPERFTLLDRVERARRRRCWPPAPRPSATAVSAPVASK